LTEQRPALTPAVAIRLMRPEHWIKNVLVLFPVVSALRMGDARAWLHAGLAAAAFCLLASAGYIVNDVRDRESDRLHPQKKDRPLAAGTVGVPSALVLAGVLAAAGFAFAAARGLPVVLAVAAYAGLQLAYSLLLKSKMLLDAIAIALGFVLRAVAGAAAIGVGVSPWLFICTFTLCLFLAFCKRRNEVATLPDADEARRHRPTLQGYTPELLTHLTTFSAGVAVVSFLVYALSESPIRRRAGGPSLVYTLPIVIYAIFRFAMLSMRGRYADPTDLILHDRPFQLTLALWAAAVALVLCCGAELAGWLTGGG